MKLKKLVIPKYYFTDDLGRFLCQDVTVLVDVNDLTHPSRFDQEKNKHFLSSDEIKRLSHESAQGFFNSKYMKIIEDSDSITPQELNGIKVFLGVNGSGLAKLISMDKSSISRMLKGTQPIERDHVLLIMEKMKNEIENPGQSKAIVNKFNKTDQEARFEF